MSDQRVHERYDELEIVAVRNRDNPIGRRARELQLLLIEKHGLRPPPQVVGLKAITHSIKRI
jgi:hypothetical protein